MKYIKIKIDEQQSKISGYPVGTEVEIPISERTDIGNTTGTGSKKALNLLKQINKDMEKLIEIAPRVKINILEEGVSIADVSELVQRIDNNYRKADGYLSESENISRECLIETGKMRKNIGGLSWATISRFDPHGRLQYFTPEEMTEGENEYINYLLSAIRLYSGHYNRLLDIMKTKKYITKRGEIRKVEIADKHYLINNNKLFDAVKQQKFTPWKQWEQDNF